MKILCNLHGSRRSVYDAANAEERNNMLAYGWYIKHCHITETDYAAKRYEYLAHIFAKFVHWSEDAEILHRCAGHIYYCHIIHAMIYIADLQGSKDLQPETFGR